MANKLQGLSYPQLVTAYNSGALNWDDVRSEYKRLRDTAMRQIRRIKKSEVPYIDENSQPQFKAPSELTTLSDYLRETADLNKFMANKTLYTISGRKAHRDSIIATLRSRGWNVTQENWLVYLAYYRTMYDCQLAIYRYIDSPISAKKSELCKCASKIAFERIFEHG